MLKENQWFLYRNPNPSTIEIWANGNAAPDFKELTEHCDDEPIFFDIKPDYYAYTYSAKIAHRDEFADMLNTVKMLAKWKRSHEEK